MRRSSTLLPCFLGLLAARGLAPEALDTWRAWIVFKQYARAVAETPDPGVSVQIECRPGSSTAHLYFVRQVVEPDEDWLRPVGGVVCEFSFSNAPASATTFEAWSFDWRSFERFVDVVEAHPGFADLVGRRPVASTVYWEEA